MQSGWSCPGVPGVGKGEARWIDDQVDALNEALAAAAGAVGRRTGADLAYVAVTDEFDGHGACRLWRRDRYVNDRLSGATFGRRRDDGGAIVDHRVDGVLTISASSFHPNQGGYDAYARALMASI
jgi:lysophospholipase L1-like esterase